MQLPQKWVASLTKCWRNSLRGAPWSKYSGSTWKFQIITHIIFNCEQKLAQVFKDSTCQGFPVGRHFWAWDKISEVWTSMSDFPFWVFQQIRRRRRSQGMPASLGKAYLILEWSIEVSIPWLFFHFWCFDCWKVQRGVVVAQKQVGCSSALKSGRSAVSNIDVLFWEIPAARNLDIFSFLLIDVIRGWWEGRRGSFLHCRHQIVSASASKLGGFLAKLPSWRGNKMALLKILTLGKLNAMSRHGSKIRESCKGQLVTTPPTELWLPNLEVGTLKSELSGLLRKSDSWGRAEGACWEKDPNSGSSWPGQWTHPLAISSDH